MTRTLAFQFWMNARVTVLGSGTSHGVPMIGCNCAVCRSADPRDRRTRPSIYHRGRRTAPTILVDTSTDLRAQALRHGVRRVDAILFTHSHADHVMGLDDVRRFNQMQRARSRAMPTSGTLATLRRTFCYVFDPPNEKGGGLPQIELHTIDGAVHRSAASSIEPVPLLHGARPILGFRFGIVRLPDRLQSHSRRVVAAARWRRRRWCSTRCAIGRTRRTSAWPKRWRSVERMQAAAGLPHAHLPRPAARGDHAALPAGVELGL